MNTTTALVLILLGAGIGYLVVTGNAAAQINAEKTKDGVRLSTKLGD